MHRRCAAAFVLWFAPLCLRAESASVFVPVVFASAGTTPSDRFGLQSADWVSTLTVVNFTSDRHTFRYKRLFGSGSLDDACLEPISVPAMSTFELSRIGFI